MTFQEYPKFLPEFDLIVESAEQEKAVRAGRAEIKETRSAAKGTDRKVTGTKARKIAVKDSKPRGTKKGK